MAAKRGEYLRHVYLIMAQEPTNECVAWPYSRDKDGYADRVKFKGTRKRVSSVICELKNGEKPSLQYEAAHTCGKGHDGCVNPRHLRWSTHKENCADKAEHGTIQRGEKNPAAVLRESHVREIMALKGHATHREIGNIFGVSKSTVQHIHTGRKWGHLFLDTRPAVSPRMP